MEKRAGVPTRGTMPPVSQRLFDAKFGAAFVEDLPAVPGVYVFRDDLGGALYVGKAKNLRRRLRTYRLAGRRRSHRKMRLLVREAASLEVRPLGSEREALLTENALIRELRPRRNVDGAFTFLYPALGLGRSDGHTLLCFSTMPEAFRDLDLQWFGAFRSRPRARDAFEALVHLLGFVGHLSKRTQLPAHPRVRGSRLVGLRQVPGDLARRLAPFLGGEDRGLLAGLATALLAKPQACRRAAAVEESLRRLDQFYEADARRLRDVLTRLGRDGFVPQAERDALFIAARYDAGE
jgi:predicted GIY-YIG superfamily endonuclease